VELGEEELSRPDPLRRLELVRSVLDEAPASLVTGESAIGGFQSGEDRLDGFSVPVVRASYQTVPTGGAAATGARAPREADRSIAVAAYTTTRTTSHRTAVRGSERTM
jgi:hypothetical protein